MKVYFDMCSLQRPLDDKAQLRVLVEAQAVEAVLALCESGSVELIASDALVFETDANPYDLRRDFAAQAISKAVHFVQSTDQLQALAQSYVDAGIKPLDALHLASAKEAKADYFCTCDDRFLKRARTLGLAQMKIVSPFELISDLQA